MNKVKRLMLVAGFASLVSGAAMAAVGVAKEESYKIAPSQLRCWQHGELIFSEDGWTPPAQLDTDNAVAFNAKGSAKTKLYMFDLENATCLLKAD